MGATVRVDQEDSLGDKRREPGRGTLGALEMGARMCPPALGTNSSALGAMGVGAQVRCFLVFQVWCFVRYHTKSCPSLPLEHELEDQLVLSHQLLHGLQHLLRSGSRSIWSGVGWWRVTLLPRGVWVRRGTSLGVVTLRSYC